MFCGQCGAEIKEGNKFCQKCGAEVQPIEESKPAGKAPPEDPKKKKEEEPMSGAGFLKRWFKESPGTH